MRFGAPALRRVAAVALALCALAACGKKGPPLAPLRPLPGPVSELAARRTGNEVRFTFRLPAQNIDATRPVSLDRLEVYAVTIAADAPMPGNQELLVPKYLVGTIPVRPVAPEGEAAEPAPAGQAPPEKTEDPRPAPGDMTTFVEELNEARMRPQVVPARVTGRGAASTTTAVAAAWVAAMALVKEAPVPNRVYVIRGVALHGRPGQPSERVTLPVADVPPPPTNVTAAASESKVTLAWSAPVSVDPLAALAAPPVFNIYTASGTAPLNAKPLTTTAFEREGVTFGTEECFVVRTAIVRGNVTVESAPSAPACVTPADTFAPAAPKGLSVVATEGAVNLIWEANTEADLGGYIVLRGEAPGDKLQAITATPIRETTYRDATATPGVRYVYAVVAVDRSTPPNTSPQSNRVEETAR